MWKLPLLEASTAAKDHVDVDLIAVFQDSAKKAIPTKGIYSKYIERLKNRISSRPS